VGVEYDPKGTHSVRTALGFFPGICAWLRPRLEPYSPR
jgi:hypothetical protein